MRKSSPFNRQQSGSFKRGKAPWYLWMALFLAAVALVIFCILNIAPYQAAVEWAMAKSGLVAAMTPFAGVPIIGPLFNFIMKAAVGLVLGSLLWAFIQTMELLPILLWHDRKVLREILHDNESHRKFQVREDDTAIEQAIKEHYNRMPFDLIATARQRSFFAYGFDFVICTLIYPPVANGNILDAIGYLATGRLHRLDWGNILMSIVSLFAVEVVLMVYLAISRAIKMYGVSRKPAQPKDATPA